MPPLLLHIDDRDELPAGARAALERDGFRIRQTTDPEEAMRLVEEQHPALVVMEIELLGCEGMHLMSCIRDPQLSVPVLVITRVPRDSALHGEAIALGVEDFLTKPVDREDLLAAIYEVVSPGNRSAREDRPSVDLSGELSETPMPELLARLHRRGANGMLAARHGDVRVGVQLRNGSLVGVSSSRGELVAETALYETFGWESGRFAFSEGLRLESESLLELPADTPALLMAGVLDASPRHLVHERLAKREHLYVCTTEQTESGFDTGGIELTAEQRRLLDDLGGGDTLSVLLRSRAFNEKLVYALWVGGWLELRTAPTLTLTDLLGDSGQQGPELEYPEPPGDAWDGQREREREERARGAREREQARDAREREREREARERELRQLAHTRKLRERKLEELARAREERERELDELARARAEREQELAALAPALDERTQELEALARKRKQRARELKALARKREERAQELEELGRAREARERELEELARAREQHARELEELAPAVDARSQELKDLARKKEELSRELEELARARAESERELEELARRREERTQELEELAGLLDERGHELEQLGRVRTEHQREVEELLRARAEHALELEELAQAREESARELEELGRAREERAQEVQALGRERAECVRELEELKRARKQSVRELEELKRARKQSVRELEELQASSLESEAPPLEAEAPSVETDPPADELEISIDTSELEESESTPEPAAPAPAEAEPKHGEIALVGATPRPTDLHTVARTLRELAERVLAGDDFQVLGISPSATDEEACAAYESLLAEVPDIELTAATLVHAQRASRIRSRIEAAFANLRNEEQRRAYSLLREEEEQDRKEQSGAERALEGERWFRKGQAHLEQRRHEEAVEAFGMALHLDPEQGEYSAHLGYALYLTKPKDDVVQREAMEHVAKGIKRSPKNELSYLYLGRILKAKGDTDVARKLFQKALRIKPGFHPAVQELRVIEMRERKAKGVLSRLMGR